MYDRAPAEGTVLLLHGSAGRMERRCQNVWAKLLRRRRQQRRPEVMIKLFIHPMYHFQCDQTLHFDYNVPGSQRAFFAIRSARPTPAARHAWLQGCKLRLGCCVDTNLISLIDFVTRSTSVANRVLNISQTLFPSLSNWRCTGVGPAAT